MKFIFLIFLFLFSCAGPEALYINKENLLMHQCDIPVFIGISSNIGKNEQKYILSAIDFWNKELGREIFSYIGINNDNIEGIYIIQHPEEEYKMNNGPIIAKTHFSFHKNGCIKQGYVEILRFLDKMEERYAYFSIKHELGHILGLRDSTIPGRIMYGKMPNMYEIYPENLTNGERESLKIFY